MAVADADFGKLNPYSGVAGALSPYRIDPAVLKEESEFILPDGSTGKQTMGEKLLFQTGACYIAGIGAGSAWGIAEGLRRSAEMSSKLKMNSVLNSIGRRGPVVANNLATVALMYRLIDTTIVKARGNTDDVYNRMGSAVLAGVAFKSTAGVRAMAIGGGIGLALAGSVALVSGMPTFS